MSLGRGVPLDQDSCLPFPHRFWALRNTDPTALPSAAPAVWGWGCRGSWIPLLVQSALGRAAENLQL